MPLQSKGKPFSSSAFSSGHTSNASTVPPGKKWPTARVRTTASTRTLYPAGTTACVVALHERHAAVGALHGLARIVDRARSQSRHAAGLPRVVVIKTSKPPVIVDRLVQVDLVAGRPELRGVLPMEVLNKGSAVRF